MPSKTQANTQSAGATKAEEFETKTLDIRRVARVVAGGRRFSFRTVVVSSNRKGQVGIGIAKSSTIAEAIAKATRQAQKNLVSVPFKNGTIPRSIKKRYKTVTILLRPAKAGKGVVAGGALRSIILVSGIKDISAKILSRSTNPINTARAALMAFQDLQRYV